MTLSIISAFLAALFATLNGVLVKTYDASNISMVELLVACLGAGILLAITGDFNSELIYLSSRLASNFSPSRRRNLVCLHSKHPRHEGPHPFHHYNSHQPRTHLLYSPCRSHFWRRRGDGPEFLHRRLSHHRRDYPQYLHKTQVDVCFNSSPSILRCYFHREEVLKRRRLS